MAAVCGLFVLPGCGKDEPPGLKESIKILLDTDQDIEYRREMAAHLRVFNNDDERPLSVNALMLVIKHDPDREVVLIALQSIRHLGPYTKAFEHDLQEMVYDEEDQVIKFAMVAVLKELQQRASRTERGVGSADAGNPLPGNTFKPRDYKE